MCLSELFLNLQFTYLIRFLTLAKQQQSEMTFFMGTYMLFNVFVHKGLAYHHLMET